MKLRLATPDDWARLFDWRNDPETIAQSWSDAPVETTEHQAWLEKTLADKRARLFIAEDTERSLIVGTGRLDIRGKKVELSLTIDPRHRGKGYGTLMIDALLVRAGGLTPLPERAVAAVKPGNSASLRAFAANGFTPVKWAEDRVDLERKL